MKADVLVACVTSLVMGCGVVATRHHLGPKGDIECAAEAAWCPTHDDLLQVEGAFADHYDTPLPVETVRVKMHAAGPFVDSYGREVNGAHGRYWAEVFNLGGLVHERMHLQRDAEDRPDVDADDAETETEIKAELREALGVE